MPRWTALFLEKLRFYFLPLLSGFFMGTSYMPFPPWAVFFCFVPLWLFALKRERLKPLLMGGWLCQFLGSLIGFSWLAFAIEEFGFLPWPLSLLGLLIFAGFANLHIPISLGLWLISKKALAPPAKNLFQRLFLKKEGRALSLKEGRQAPWALWLLLPLYSALCWEYYPMIFEWHFGYTWLYAGWPAFQTAELWGFKFLNTLTLLFNFLFLISFKNLWPKKAFSLKRGGELKTGKGFKIAATIFFSREGLRQFLAFLRSLENKKTSGVLALTIAVVFLFLSLLGLYLKGRQPGPDKKAYILFVQPNIKNHQQGKEEWDDFILSELLQETSQFIWPDYNDSFKGEISGFSPPLSPGASSREMADLKAGITKQKNLSAPPVLPENEGAKKPSRPENQTKRRLDLILWPEGAYPYNIDKTQALRGEDPAQKWPRVFGFPLAISAGGVGPAGHYNSVFVFDEKGALAQGPYDKTVLMPFGEYVPFEKLFPFLSRFLFGDISFHRGTGQNKIIRLKGLSFGLSVCYESLFDKPGRLLAGADILLNFANEAWFGLRQEPYQNLYMTLARAVELRRPLARAANSGFSAVISAKGAISGPGGLGKKLAWLAEVPYYSEENKRLSLFASWGYYINQVFIWLALAFCLARRMFF